MYSTFQVHQVNQRNFEASSIFCYTGTHTEEEVGIAELPDASNINI